MTANASASGATTVLVGPTFTPAGNTLAVGQVYRARASVRYVRVGTAAMSLRFALRVGGVALVSLDVVTPTVAATYDGFVEAYFSVRAIGVSGQFMSSIHIAMGGTTQAQDFGGHLVDIVTDGGHNTTGALTFDLVVSMLTGTASNVLTISQGFFDRVV